MSDVSFDLDGGYLAYRQRQLKWDRFVQDQKFTKCQYFNARDDAQSDANDWLWHECQDHQGDIQEGQVVVQTCVVNVQNERNEARESEQQRIR